MIATLPPNAAMYESSTRDAQADRRRRIRDAMVEALHQAGGAMSPQDLAVAAAERVVNVTISAQNFTRYFVILRCNGRTSIDLHPHLRIYRTRPGNPSRLDCGQRPR
jgi:hypothetical protein